MTTIHAALQLSLPSFIEDGCRHLNIKKNLQKLHHTVSEIARSTLASFRAFMTPTNLIIGTCASVYVITPYKYPHLLLVGSFCLPRILNGEVWRLFTHTVLHGSVIHLFSNMQALYKLGPTVEKIWGAIGFAKIATLTVITEVALNLLFPKHSPSGAEQHSVGFSGVCCGIQGAIFARAVKNEEKDKILPIFFKMIGRELLTDFIMTQYLGVNIDILGHIAGYIGGMTFGLLDSNRSQR